MEMTCLAYLFNLVFHISTGIEYHSKITNRRWRLNSFTPYFLRRLIFGSWSRTHKIRLLSIWKFFTYCCDSHIVISILLKTAQISINSQLLVKLFFFFFDRTRKKTLLRRLKNIGMASEKLYRNTLILFLELDSDKCFSGNEFSNATLRVC